MSSKLRAPVADPEKKLARLANDHEDLERQPDGVPHDIVGRTLLAATMLSIVAFAVLILEGLVPALLVVVMALPIVVFLLGQRSERERDHTHPSR